MRLMMLALLLFPTKSLRLLQTEYLTLKKGEEATFTITLPEKNVVTLLVSGEFPKRTLIEIRGDEETYSQEKGGEETDYAVFPFSSPHREFTLKFKNVSENEEEIKFYVDSSLIEIKNIPLEHGFFVREFQKKDEIAVVECVFPFRSKNRIWIKRLVKGQLEEALYTSVAYSENIALKKAEVKGEPGRYLVFAEVKEGKGFVNCDINVKEMAVKRVRKWKGGVLIILGIAALLIAGILFFFKKT